MRTLGAGPVTGARASRISDRHQAGVTSYWYSLGDVATQAARSAGLGRRSGLGSVGLRGDAAADLLAPWRRPEYSPVCVVAATPLASAGPVPGRLGRPGALTLHAAKDQGVWLPRPWVVDGVPLADPLEVANELATSPAVDSIEAITQLWQAL